MKGCTHTLILITSILLFNPPRAFCQVQKSIDTAYINSLTKRSFELRYDDPDSCALLAKHAIDLSASINYLKGLGDGYMYLGILQKNLVNYDSALIFYKKSLGYRKQLKSPTDAGKAYSNIATIYNLKGTFDSALFYQVEALRIAEATLDSTNLVICLNNLGFIYQRLKNYPQSEEYFTKSFKIAKERDNERELSRAYGNLGSLYTDMSDYDKAKNFLWLNVASATRLGVKLDLANSYNNLGAIYNDSEIFDSAIYYFKQAAKMDSIIDRRRDLAIVLSNIGLLLRKENRFQESLYYNQRSLEISLEIGDKQLTAIIYNVLTEAYEGLGDYKNAYRASQKYMEYHDSVFSEKSDSTLTVVQTKYETEKKDQQIKLLNKDKDLQAAMISRQRILRNALIAAAALILLAAFLFISRLRLRQQHKTLAERSRISGELHDDIGATLSSFSIYSDVVKQELSSGRWEEAAKSVESIGNESRELLDRLSDIVWAINPRNDQFEKIVSRLYNYATRMCAGRNTELDFQMDHSLNDIAFTLDVRNNFYLVMKEAINNAVKYSGASKLSVSIKKNGKFIEALVQDNGKGFDLSLTSEGNGLRNMKQRANDIKASFELESTVGNGSRMALSIPG